VETLVAAEAWLEKPAIYSPQALLGFSTLVNPLMGGLRFVAASWPGFGRLVGALR
jgi:hypothetical protein